MSFANQLIELTDTSRREAEKIPRMQKMLSGDFSEQKYLNFMKDLYPIVANFCPIMAVAAGRCADQYDQVRLYLYDHIHEEKNHEKIVLQDIASFGVSSAEVTNSALSEPVQAMLSFNYYSALMKNPCNVLGMVYVLEIMSSVYAGKIAGAIAAALDRNVTNGFSFLHSHSSVDLEHMAKLRQLFQSIDSPEIFTELMNSIKMNFYLFFQILGRE